MKIIIVWLLAWFFSWSIALIMSGYCPEVFLPWSALFSLVLTSAMFMVRRQSGWGVVKKSAVFSLALTAVFAIAVSFLPYFSELRSIWDLLAEAIGIYLSLGAFWLIVTAATTIMCYGWMSFVALAMIAKKMLRS